MDRERPLCYCFQISKRKIVNYVKQTRPLRASMISNCFGAGTGCGWCIPFLKRIHQQIVGGEAIEAQDITPEEYEAKRRDYLLGIKSGTQARNRHEEPHAEWDVSGYFSKTPKAEPEADLLGGGSSES